MRNLSIIFNASTHTYTHTRSHRCKMQSGVVGPTKVGDCRRSEREIWIIRRTAKWRKKHFNIKKASGWCTLCICMPNNHDGLAINVWCVFCQITERISILVVWHSSLMNHSYPSIYSLTHSLCVCFRLHSTVSRKEKKKGHLTNN